MAKLKEVLNLSAQEGALSGQGLLDALAKVPPEKIAEVPALAPIISSATSVLTPLMTAVTAFNAIMSAIKIATDVAETLTATVALTTLPPNPGPTTAQTQKALANSQTELANQAKNAEQVAVDTILNQDVG